MNKKERQKAIDGLKETCREIGCSSMGSDTCENAPHRCDIIIKIFTHTSSIVELDAGFTGALNELSAKSGNKKPSKNRYKIDCMTFSERHFLGKHAEKWIKEIQAYEKPETVIMFLARNKLLNIKKCRKFLEENENSSRG